MAIARESDIDRPDAARAPAQDRAPAAHPAGVMAAPDAERALEQALLAELSRQDEIIRAAEPIESQALRANQQYERFAAERLERIREMDRQLAVLRDQREDLARRAHEARTAVHAARKAHALARQRLDAERDRLQQLADLAALAGTCDADPHAAPLVGTGSEA